MTRDMEDDNADRIRLLQLAGRVSRALSELDAAKRAQDEYIAVCLELGYSIGPVSRASGTSANTARAAERRHVARQEGAVLAVGQLRIEPADEPPMVSSEDGQTARPATRDIPSIWNAEKPARRRKSGDGAGRVI